MRGELKRLITLLRKAADADRRELWGVLTIEERTDGLLRWIRNENGDDHELKAAQRKLLAALLLRDKRGFRPGAISAWPLERICAEVARRPRMEAPNALEGTIYAHHNERRLAVVQAPLLDRLGIPNEAGVVDGDALDVLSQIEPDRICARALETWRGQRSRDMALYLVALPLLLPERWTSLFSILPTIADELEELSTTASPPERAGDDPPSEMRSERAQSKGTSTQSVAGQSLRREMDNEEGPESQRDEDSAAHHPPPDRAGVRHSSSVLLTALDEQIILRIADSLQGVVGAPDEATLDRIIQELLSLNGSRHQSYYHLGLHDAVRGRSARNLLPAQNPSRWRWYYAGHIAGLARNGQMVEIVRLYDDRTEVQTLGDSGVGASRYCAEHVVRALVAFGRSADVVAFVAPAAVARMSALAQLLLDVGTTLQREQRMSDASLFFELLLRAQGDGEALTPSYWSTVKRRYAHCLRAEDKLEAARSLLEEALEDADEVERAMVLVDLGLIDAGFGRLSDLRLPSSIAAATEMVTRLERSAKTFRDAERLDVSTSSHARYVLGMQALLNRDYALAEVYLASAVAVFDLQRERYEPAGLLRRTHLYLAVSRCANTESDPHRLEQAVRDIAEAISEPDVLPDCFAEEVIAGLSLRHADVGGPLIEKLLAGDHATLLDSLRSDDKARSSAPVADALARRFRRAHRTMSDRIEDGCILIEMLMRQGRYEEAGATLDEAGELAVRSPSGARMLQLLECAVGLSAVWEPEQISRSRVRILESLGRYGDAAECLIPQLHRALAAGDVQAALDASDILESIEGYGCRDAGELQSYRRRLERCASPPPLPTPSAALPVTVLVVGGNETQAQYDAAIRLHYREAAPWLTVKFMHTGWSSNWGEKVEEFERRVMQADAVVLIYLMRTEFGRAVRKRMGSTPWRGCGGKGKNSIQRAIDAAAAAVAQT